MRTEILVYVDNREGDLLVYQVERTRRVLLHATAHFAETDIAQDAVDIACRIRDARQRGSTCTSLTPDHWRILTDVLAWGFERATPENGDEAECAWLLDMLGVQL